MTIEGDLTPSAVVALLAGELGGEARLRFKNGLLRASGDLVNVAPGRRLDLDIDNAVIATGGTLVHGHGLPVGRTAEPLKVVLRQVTARLAGGLARLQSTPTEPELPVADVLARDTILATNDPESPLFRVNGQGNLDNLRGLIHWEGRSVAYHQINTYRRDQSAQPGGSCPRSSTASRGTSPSARSKSRPSTTTSSSRANGDPTAAPGPSAPPTSASAPTAPPPTSAPSCRRSPARRGRRRRWIVRRSNPKG